MIGAMLQGDGVRLPPSREALETDTTGILVVRITMGKGNAKSAG